MDFYKWSFDDILILNNFGIPEPQKNEKVIPDILLYHWFHLIKIYLELDMVVDFMTDILKKFQNLKKF